jgi:hypothetical protein
MAVYRGLGGGLFAENTAALGLKSASRFMVGWGVALPDLDNDSRREIICTNGHLDQLPDGTPYAMPTQVFTSTSAGRFVEITGTAGSDLAQPRVGRALAAGDLDHDGLVDVLVGAHDSPLIYLHNETPGTGHSITLELLGDARNRDAIGALVEIESGNVRHAVQRTAGGSYQSAGSPRIHVGLGAAVAGVTVRVRWPSGHMDEYRNLLADQGYRLEAGGKAAARLPGYPGITPPGPAAAGAGGKTGAN